MPICPLYGLSTTRSCVRLIQQLPREKLVFHIASFISRYQALLGREAFARFNAIPHYASVTLKMPGPRGIISLKGNIN